ncbi:hypothetical protein LSPCS325_29120 [Lysinibacillus sp. CTST325]
MNFYLLWEKSDKKALFKNAGEDSNIRKCDECRGGRSILKKPLNIQLRDKETSDFYKVGYDVIGGGNQDILIRHNFKGVQIIPYRN